MAAGWEEHLEELRRRKREAHAQRGPEAIARLHARGKLSARERMGRVVDPGSFHEIGLLAEGV
jgi:acetyl-CoA carboxylase carboxyltransferase component